VARGEPTDAGCFDVFVTHLNTETHALWRQVDRGRFQDRTAASGLGGPRWQGTGFGTVLADFDLDGSLDLAIVNGAVRRPEESTEGGSVWAAYAERNQLFANDRAGRFREVSLANQPFCGSAAISRGLAVGDVDGDGALDLLVTAVAGPVRLFRNIAPDRGHWLLVRAIDPRLGGRD